MDSNQKLPRSEEIERYYLYHSKNIISLAIERDDFIHYPIDSGGQVSLIPIVLREGDNFFYDVWTNEILPDRERYVKNDRHISMSASSTNGRSVCTLDVSRWSELVPIPRRRATKNAFDYAHQLMLDCLNGIDTWLLQNVRLSLDNVCLGSGDSGRGQYRIGVPRMTNKTPLPSFVRMVSTKVTSSISLMLPGPEHPNGPVLDAAIKYQKKTSEQALSEAAGAYAGTVNVEEFIAKARAEYLAVLRTASLEFRERFDIK